MRARPYVVAGILAAAGCTGNAPSDVDAGLVPFDGELCPGGEIPAGATLAGEVVVGSGIDFEPLEDDTEVILIAPPDQGSAMFMIHPRIRGLEPGVPGNNNSPLNPYTLFSAYTEDGVKISPLDCIPASLPYRQGESTPDDAYDLGYERRLIVRGEFGEAELHDQRVRLVVEVLDHWGRYAVGEVWVRVNYQS